jgi:hypothetical protein
MALPRDLQRALDQMDPAIRRAFEEAVGRIVSAIVLRDLTDAIARNDVEAALRALRLEREFFQPLERAIEAAFYAGGVAALSTPIVAPNGERYLIGFDGRHPRAEAWARANVGDRIVEIVADQRLMARDVIERQIVAGVNPRTAALDIVGKVNRATGQREGGFIGLTRQQSGFVDNMRADLAGLDERYFTRQRRDRRYDSLVRRAIADGRPLGQADVDRISAAYKRRLLAYRGETIARTESINALRAGRHEGYEQLVERTDIRADQLVRTWDATGDARTRPDHMAMNGQEIVGLAQPFVAPDGSRLMYPGDSSLGAAADQVIQCRCFERVRVRFIDG